jgi:hypothetical protein
MAASRSSLHAELQALETAARGLSRKLYESAMDSRIEIAAYREACAHMTHVSTGLQMAKFALNEFQGEPKS